MVRARYGAHAHNSLASHAFAQCCRLAPHRKDEARIPGRRAQSVFAPISDLWPLIIDEGTTRAIRAAPARTRPQVPSTARLAKAHIVMGSATPSPEAWQACMDGRMRRFNLTNRPAGGSFPSIRIVDMRGRQGLISEELAQALRDAKSAGRQSILFLNRRGFARTLICQTCGAEVLCRHCSVPLTYHKTSGRLVCHYCGYSESKPVACPECGSLDLVWASYGTGAHRGRTV